MTSKDKSDERQEHPSFAVIGVSRVSSGPPGYTLFDSPFHHQHFIQITIRRAYKYRQLHRDNIGDLGGELIQVHMSEVQFANMVTSPNMGVGTPCTISHFDGKRVPEPPADQLKKTFSTEIAEGLVDLKKSATELERLTNMTDPKAADRKRMRDLAGQIQRAFSDNRREIGRASCRERV